MQREIKFRGKIKEKGISECWIEGSLIHITRTYKGEEDEQECDIYQIINEDGAGFFIDKDTIGQFTGLHDKNGKEIYEGDIVKVKYKGKEDIGKIIYEYNGFTINVMNMKRPYGRVDLIEIFTEVIGNIYDNPELLEV